MKRRRQPRKDWGKKAFQAKGTADKNGKAETSLGCLRSSKKEEEKEERKRGRRWHWRSRWKQVI